MIRGLAALFILLAGLGTAGAQSSYDQAFVDAFAEACVPGRLGYDSTRQAALAAGWTETGRDDHAELDAVMAVSDAEIAADPEFVSFSTASFFTRDVAGSPHHVVVTHSGFIIEEGDDPWVLIGCHLYNFDATAPVAPEPVTAFVGKPISNSAEQEGFVGHVWGPPCPLPRTGDVYLTFIGAQNDAARTTAFTGTTLNFSTSVPDEGEEVPDTYC